MLLSCARIFDSQKREGKKGKGRKREEKEMEGKLNN